MHTRLSRLALTVVALLPLGGCAALSSLDASSQTLPTYQLSAPVSQVRSGSGPTLSVERPAATGAVDSERIAIRPGPLTIEYLPDGQWVDPAPNLVRDLLVQALAGTGRFALVTGEMGGPLPSLALYSDLEAFEAVVGAGPDGEGRTIQVVVRLRLALVRDTDRSLVATRVFERRASAAGDGTAQIVAAFDAALAALLPEAANWTASAARGGV